MEITLTFKVDIKDMQAVVYAAKKEIEHGENTRDQERLDIMHNDQDLLRNAAIRPAPREVNYRHANELDVYKFMALDDEDKIKYVCVDEYENGYDIRIFDRRKVEMRCDVCGVGVNLELHFLIGTPDTREPKFCMQHYANINRDSRFVKKGLMVI